MRPTSTEPYLCPLCQSEMDFEDSDEPKIVGRYRCPACGTLVELGQEPPEDEPGDPDEPEDTE